MSDRARAAAAKYASLEGDEKCVFAGKLMRQTWYSAIYAPERYPALAAKRQAAREQQIPPWLKDPAMDSVRTWVAMGGRGSGKTRLATGYIIPEALERPGLRVGVLGPDFKVSVGVGITGRSGIKTLLDAFDESLIFRWNEVKNVLTLANGSTITCLSSENPKSIEGPEFHLYWVDEVAELIGQGGDECIWRKRAEPGIRLLGDNGESIRKIITGTPEATPLIQDLHQSWEKYPDRYHWTQLATRDNIANLDEQMVEQMYEEAGDSLFAKMKLEGQLILESPHALLNQTDLARIRVGQGDERHLDVTQLDDVVLAVDANHSDDKKSDECGIIVLGRKGRRAHVLADASIAGGPKKWGDRIIEALIAFPEIDRVVVEDDKSLVLEVVQKVLRDDLVAVGRPVKIVPMQHGNRSKKQRADPVAVEYQLTHVLHDPSQRMPAWASLERLEWQWVSWNPKLTGPKAKSPDRLDAAVYGVTHLLLTGRQKDSWGAPSSIQTPRSEPREDPLDRIFLAASPAARFGDAGRWGPNTPAEVAAMERAGDGALADLRRNGGALFRRL